MAGLISWRNWADAATLTPTYSGFTATVDSNYPMTNLQTRQLSTVCRYSSAAHAIYIQADLGVERDVDLCAVLAIRARTYDPGSGSSNAYTINVRVSNVSDFSTLIYSGSSSSTMNPLVGAPANVHHQLPAGTRGRYVQIRVQFSSPSGETFAEAGRVWIGDALSLPGSMDAGVQAQWSISALDFGDLDVSAGFQHYASPKAKARRLGIDVLCNDICAFGFDDNDAIHYAEPSLQALQFEAGTTGEVIVIPRTTTPLWIQAVNVYGHIERPFDIQHVAGPNYRANLTVIEER